jgi:hypothetical protein
VQERIDDGDRLDRFIADLDANLKASDDRHRHGCMRPRSVQEKPPSDPCQAAASESDGLSMPRLMKIQFEIGQPETRSPPPSFTAATYRVAR